MVDVALTWIVMPDKQPPATRTQVREWCEELGLKGGVTELALGGLFREISEAVDFRYDYEGPCSLLLRESANKRKEVVIRELFSLNPDRPPLKLAQVKLTLTRRNKLGEIPGSHDLGITMRNGLPDEHVLAVTEWYVAFRSLFASRQELIQMHSVRRVVRFAMEETGFPCRRRSSLYFVYAEHLPLLDRLGEFVSRVGIGAELFSVHLRDDPSEHRVIADAADEHLLTLAVEHELHVAVALERQPNIALRSHLMNVRKRQNLLAATVAMHTERLGQLLPRATHVLAECEEKISSLEPPGHLHTVTER